MSRCARPPLPASLRSVHVCKWGVLWGQQPHTDLFKHNLLQFPSFLMNQELQSASLLAVSTYIKT